MSDPKSRKLGEHVSSEAESSRASSLIEKLMTKIVLEERLNPKLTLKRFLSINSVVSPSSSFAEREQAAVGANLPYRCIGSGTCGAVFEIPGTPNIFKVAKNPGQDTDMLWNDYQTHTKVSEIFDRIGRANLTVYVPRVGYFAGMTDSEFWDANIDRFPQQYQQVSNLLCAERILPLAKPIRELLVDMYCPEQLKAEIKSSVPNRDCLVRIYLGKRRGKSNNRFFQLRNFSLHLDQIEELELNPMELAGHIAEALAVMHWAVGSDANDVEFVLGSAPDRVANPTMITPKPLTSSEISKLPRNTSAWAAHHEDFKRRITHLWMLDFNRCKPFTSTKSGIENLVKAFFRNDPYFPLPHAKIPKDQQLWSFFKNQYLNRSAYFVGKTNHAKLPQVFIDMVVEEQRKKIEALSQSAK